jgi:signal transduction histidine kinase
MVALLGAAAAYAIPILPRYPVVWTSYSLTGPFLIMLIAFVMGLGARRHRLAAQEQIVHAAETARAEAQQRVAEERLAIARELHDVLAHTISVIAVQSGAALDALDTDVEAARESMRTVRTVARHAMPDLRHALAMLRETGTVPADQPAQPHLAGLAELADRVRTAGLPVDLTIAPDLPDVTPYVELAAYRIVQEALTNTVRHAEATRVEVAVARDGGYLVVRVLDDGRGMAPEAGGGYGLLGMRERAALVGGAVDIRTARSGGTVVEARLPGAGEMR